MPQRLIASEDLPAKKGITLKNAQRRQLEDAGQFPARVYISERKHGYVESDRDSKLAKQTAA